MTDLIDKSNSTLASFIRCYDDALSKDFCAQMIQEFERHANLHTVLGRGSHAGMEASAWTELDLKPFDGEALRQMLLTQIKKYLAAYNEAVNLTLPVVDYGTYQSLRIKRYRAGQDEGFQPHYDAGGNLSHRYLVFLWYLNDVAEGGETEFCDLGLKFSARAGRLLVFPPYWMYQHAGLPPISNDKYIVSTYLMFPWNSASNSRPLANADAKSPQ
jgi:prolyl 4-hydroxylase